MGGSNKIKRNGDKVYSDQSHIYNISSGYWYELPKMTTPKEVNGVIIKNKVYLIGGQNEKPLTEIESYDLASGKWNKEGNLFYGLENPAVTSNNNMIFIFNNGRLLTYNVVSKILNEYRIGIQLESAQMYFHEDQLYILGGFNEVDFTKIPSSTLYAIDVKSFENTEILNSTAFLQKNDTQAIIN